MDSLRALYANPYLRPLFYTICSGLSVQCLGYIIMLFFNNYLLTNPLYHTHGFHKDLLPQIHFCYSVYYCLSVFCIVWNFSNCFLLQWCKNQF